MAVGVAGRRAAPRAASAAEAAGIEGAACRLPREGAEMAGVGGEGAEAAGAARNAAPLETLCPQPAVGGTSCLPDPTPADLASPPRDLFWGALFGGLGGFAELRAHSGPAGRPHVIPLRARRVQGARRSKSGASGERGRRMEGPGTAGPISLPFAHSLFQAQPP